MRSAGTVVNFTRKGSLILRSRETPGIGDIVVDRRSTRIGRIVRITGPVGSPYLIVKNDVDDPEVLKTLPGRELFISDRKERERQSGRTRKSSDRGQKRPYRRYDGRRKEDFDRRPRGGRNVKRHEPKGKSKNRPRK